MLAQPPCNIYLSPSLGVLSLLGNGGRARGGGGRAGGGKYEEGGTHVLVLDFYYFPHER